ncbi:hypothetical protein Vretimale_13631 [Volvox reticuliferus]|uniref:Uncharacterized protein n=1 Tax=Volvox reticuliferus TaxID=1737510 RepID=A0A8J4LTS2_9CHLO|nr:hypothetical protein Vretifemale_476 [Volvox reticuliferus]GIM09863.1 hypothetical protein Vretimale_13631 [Volvox reticuliferus]
MSLCSMKYATILFAVSLVCPCHGSVSFSMDATILTAPAGTTAGSLDSVLFYCPCALQPLSGRRLLEKNPDFPSQRESNPSWVNGGGSPQFQVQSQNQDEQQLGGSSGAPSSDNAGSPVVASNPIVIFSGGQFGASWHDSTYGADPFTSYQPAGKDSGTASCHYLPKGSAKSFYGPQGAFNGQKALEFWAYAGSSGVADVDLLLSGAAQCRRLPLRSLSIAESSSGWVKFWVDLNLFSWVQPGGGAFSGCGTDGTSAGDLVKLDFFNSHAEYKALLCIDNVRLVP